VIDIARSWDDNEDLAVGAAELGRQDRLANRDADDGDLPDCVLRPREGGRGDDLAVHLDELQVRRRDLRLCRDLPSGDDDVRGRDRCGGLGLGRVRDEEGRRSGPDGKQKSNNQHQSGAASRSIFHSYPSLSDVLSVCRRRL